MWMFGSAKKSLPISLYVPIYLRVCYAAYAEH